MQCAEGGQAGAVVIEELIERLAKAAHKERKEMLESANRSVGQRIRYARAKLKEFINAR